MRTLAIIIVASVIIALQAATASAGPVAERLVYDATWNGMKAGSAVLEVTPQGDGFRIVNTVRSSGMVSSFFKVDNKVESLVSREGRPKFYREEIREGRHRARREATFNFSTLHADSKDLKNNTAKKDTISARTHDKLSSIYFIRYGELVPGQSTTLDIYDAKRLLKADVRVVKREEVSTPLGSFPTLMVTSQLSRDGVPSPVGSTTFWFSDDSRRIPVRMVTKLRVGEMTLTLAGSSHQR